MNGECSTHGKDGESTVAHVGKMGKLPNILVGNFQWKILEFWR